MQKLEKIILLFSLFYYLKYFAIGCKLNRKKIKNKELYLYNNFMAVKMIIYPKKLKFFFRKRIIWFLNNFKSIKNLIKNSLYFCVKLKFRVIVVCIYFRKKLLFSINRPFKKIIRRFKKLEKIYKKKKFVVWY